MHVDICGVDVKGIVGHAVTRVPAAAAAVDFRMGKRRRSKHTGCRAKVHGVADRLAASVGIAAINFGIGAENA